VRPIGRAAASVGDGGEGVTPPPPRFLGVHLDGAWVEDGLMPDLSPCPGWVEDGRKPDLPSAKGRS
jgi:hypothetical protein